MPVTHPRRCVIKKFILALAGPLAAAALFGAAPATAAPAAVTPAVTCLGGAIPPVSYHAADFPTFGPYTTTSRCDDINMHTTNGSWTQVCVVFVDHTSSCNYTTTVGPSWTTIATDVKDGTHFKVRVVGAIENNPSIVATLAF
jgi:hypothetical protein